MYFVKIIGWFSFIKIVNNHKFYLSDVIFYRNFIYRVNKRCYPWIRGYAGLSAFAFFFECLILITLSGQKFPKIFLNYFHEVRKRRRITSKNVIVFGIKSGILDTFLSAILYSFIWTTYLICLQLPTSNTSTQTTF